ncbi:MAG: hypothetical protein H8D23_21990 [Candidatus Brocadiales bacterium]|nr:hypothetical protein [Candidatus Brocadiales bacterium]
MRDVRINVHPFYPEDKIVQCPGIPEGMLFILMKDERCTSRCIKHRDDRGVVEYWVIPVDLAADWGMEWIDDVDDADESNVPCWVKHTGANEVSYIDFYKINNPEYHDKSKHRRKLWSGPLAMGWKRGVEGPYLNYLIENTPAVGRSVKRSLAKLNARQRNPKVDPRDKIFVDYYLKTGDVLNAIKVGFPHMGASGIKFCTNLAFTRLKKKSVRKYMDEKLKEQSERIFKEAGIEGDPKEWIMKRRIDVVKKAVKSDSVGMLNLAEKTISKIEQSLAEDDPLKDAPAQSPVDSKDGAGGLSPERKAELSKQREPRGNDHVSKNENHPVSELQEAEHPFDEEPKGSSD